MLIAFEGGMQLQMYQDSAGYDTIGVGHLVMDSERELFANGITEETGRRLLREDMEEAQDAVHRLVQVHLSDNQKDALISFIFNVGVGAFRRSTLLRKLNTGDYAAVPSELMRWTKAGGKENRGLKRRRRVEAALFRPDAWAHADYVAAEVGLWNKSHTPVRTG